MGCDESNLEEAMAAWLKECEVSRKQGYCPHSGLKTSACQQSICDCFYEEGTDNWTGC